MRPGGWLRELEQGAKPMAARIGYTLILGFAALHAFAGQAPPVDSSEQSFKLTATAELVLLDVSVKTAEGERAAGLTRNNFQIYEDGKLQTITYFSTEDVPVTAGLVIDASGSMSMKHPEVVTAAIAFAQASNRNDEMFVVNFNDRAGLGLPQGVSFTDNISILRQALLLDKAQGRTALYDAILLSLKQLDKGSRDRKALMLVSDGGDNCSTHRLEEVIQGVRESRATIYTIGIFDDDDADRNPGMLERLARISGGEAFFPKHLADVAGICKGIAGDIRTRYTIGYVPVRSGEKGSLRKIKVAASQPGGRKLITHSRTSYFLPDIRPGAQSGKADKKSVL
jgi:VWFA-related protein